MRAAILFAALVACLLPAVAAKADQQYVSGRNVVHTRRLPVVAHRVVPPFRGVHVYGGGRRR